MPKFLQAFCIMLDAPFVIALNASIQQSKFRASQNLLSNITNDSAGKSQLTRIFIGDTQNGFGYDIPDSLNTSVNDIWCIRKRWIYCKRECCKSSKAIYKKLQNNIMLPAITRHELGSLHIKL